jgi:hypothetical protein
MSSTEFESNEVELCQVANEVEAAMVVNLLQEEGIPARSDATASTPAFGGLPFESGHRIYVTSSVAEKAREILSQYPHFKDLKEADDSER